MVTFSNPRLKAEFSDWPSGAARVACVFEVHDGGKKGYRVSRTTQDKHGKWCKPKYSTYHGKAAIVDGSDGKTYILQIVLDYGFVKVMTHDFMTPPGIKSAFLSYEPEQYNALKSMVESAV